HKGVQVLLEALASTEVPYDVLILGQGPEEARVRWLLAQWEKRRPRSRGQNVSLMTRRVSRDALRSIRQQSDVQIVPSVPTSQWREQMNLSMLEGMACGLPVIGSRSGGIPEGVGDGGLIVTPDRPGELTEAIEFYALHNEERELAGRRARERVLRYYGLVENGNALAAVYAGVTA
ncbi:MAG: glycosyltransferase family 4 protein, partial [Thermoplasmata archaeon]